MDPTNDNDPKEMLLGPGARGTDSDWEWPSHECLQSQNRQKRAQLHRWTIFNLLGTLLVAASLLYQIRPQKFDPNSLLRETSAYSPILDSIEIPTYLSHIDGGIATSTKPSIARLPPGPEADAAWHQFEDIQTVVISRSDVLAMGKDPDTAARFPDHQWGFGADAYMGQLDMVHQLHCLNQLRKRAFAAYHNPSAERLASEKHERQWIHLQHCVSILLENVLCHADTELLTMNWIQETARPFPDFSIQRQCRDFNAILDWQAARAVNKSRFANMTKPTHGARIVQGEKEWFELFDDNEASAAMHSHLEH